MSEFDLYSDSYSDLVNDSISFTGADADYYASRKAEHLIELIGRNLGSPSQITALDVGCGIGITDGHLVDHFGHLHGVDVAGDAVNTAATQNPGVEYCDYDGQHLPFDNETVDVAFAICVAHHVPVPERPAFTAEIARVVRPGGLAVIFEHNPMNPLTRYAVSRCEFDEGVVLLTRKETKALLESSGLEVIEQRYIIFTPFNHPIIRSIERSISWLPLGAQHCVVARKPD